MKVAFGVAVAAVAVWTTANLESPRQSIGVGQECEVTTSVESVPVQAEPVEVPLRHSQAIGDSATAAFPEESGITVVSIGREDSDEPMTLRLVVNTSEAAAGEWPITVRGTAAACTGSLTVAAADTEGR